MKCKHCGEEVANDSVFCEHCGKKTDCIQSIDDRMLMIMYVASHDTAVGAAFMARSKCYSLLKNERPDYKEYVQHIQLQNYPMEYYKSQLFQRILWCMGMGAISLLWAIVDWTHYYDHGLRTFYRGTAIPATIIFGVSIWIILKVLKKFKGMTDVTESNNFKEASIMKCKHCGEKIANDSNFCEYCGKKIQKDKTIYLVIFSAILLLTAIVLVFLVW